mmetsp:Transcript_8629/g.25692  ORF Transcript_8629/g.25692 Transcript_8629/m.25692 type:complete len:183 (+) Transcript_8629:378-926(+)
MPSELPLDSALHPVGTWLQTGYLCHYACVNADTWASEVGILSKTVPRLITTLRKVPPGTNGGVSAMGTLASALGGGLIGVTYWVLGLMLLVPDASIPPQWPLVPLGFLAGLVGSFIDSLLGATVQFSGFDNKSKLAVSKPGGAMVKHTSGMNLLSNDQVNFCSSIFTVFVGTSICARLKLFG